MKYFACIVIASICCCKGTVENKKPVERQKLSERIEYFIKQLGASDPAIRDKAQEELIKIAKLALKALKKAAQDLDVERAMRVKVIIERILLDLREESLVLNIRLEKKLFLKGESINVDCIFQNEGEMPIILFKGPISKGWQRSSWSFKFRQDSLPGIRIFGGGIGIWTKFPPPLGRGNFFILHPGKVYRRHALVIKTDKIKPGKYRLKGTFNFRKPELDQDFASLEVKRLWDDVLEFNKDTNEIEIEIVDPKSK